MRADLGRHTSPVRLDDLANAVAAAKEVLAPFKFDTVWWRGHADTDWPLQAQVFRRDPEHPGVARYKEAALIGHFKSRAPTRSHQPCPATDDYFGWLFLAQHYGLPTRLLDWSESPLTALYFAVVERPDVDGCLWSLWPSGLNRYFRASTGLVQISDPKVVGIARNAFVEGSEPGKDIIAIDGQEIDVRMLVQMSRFTLHGYHSGLEVLPNSHDWLRRFIIPRETKEKLRVQLAALGMRRSNIFPDLASLAAELKAASYG